MFASPEFQRVSLFEREQERENIVSPFVKRIGLSKNEHNRTDTKILQNEERFQKEGRDVIKVGNVNFRNGKISL